jgi:hypothetical protein
VKQKKENSPFIFTVICSPGGINDSYKYIIDLATDGVVIAVAIKYVQGQMDHLNGQEKALLQDIKQQKKNQQVGVILTCV